MTPRCTSTWEPEHQSGERTNRADLLRDGPHGNLSFTYANLYILRPFTYSELHSIAAKVDRNIHTHIMYIYIHHIHIYICPYSQLGNIPTSSASAYQQPGTRATPAPLYDRTTIHPSFKAGGDAGDCFKIGTLQTLQRINLVPLSLSNSQPERVLINHEADTLFVVPRGMETYAVNEDAVPFPSN